MSDEKKSETPEWEFRKEFRISEQMREVAKASKAAAEAEIARLRRKLEKLTYGS
jgi:hypothetical protein